MPHVAACTAWGAAYAVQLAVLVSGAFRVLSLCDAKINLAIRKKYTYRFGCMCGLVYTTRNYNDESVCLCVCVSVCVYSVSLYRLFSPYIYIYIYSHVHAIVEFYLYTFHWCVIIVCHRVCVCVIAWL